MVITGVFLFHRTISGTHHASENFRGLKLDVRDILSDFTGQSYTCISMMAHIRCSQGLYTLLGLLFLALEGRASFALGSPREQILVWGDLREEVELVTKYKASCSPKDFQCWHDGKERPVEGDRSLKSSRDIFR